MTILGSIMLVCSVILFATTTDSPIGTVLFVAFVIFAVALLIHFILKRIPKTKGAYSIYLSTDQEGFYASSYDAAAIGKSGVVVADLKPAGFISVGGKRHAAISVDGYLAEGTPVVVLKGEEDHLVVKTETYS